MHRRTQEIRFAPLHICRTWKLASFFQVPHTATTKPPSSGFVFANFPTPPPRPKPRVSHDARCNFTSNQSLEIELTSYISMNYRHAPPNAKNICLRHSWHRPTRNLPTLLLSHH